MNKNRCGKKGAICTYPGRYLYYFAAIIVGIVLLTGCGITQPKSNGMAPELFDSFLEVSKPLSTTKPRLAIFSHVGQVAVEVSKRQALVEGTDLCFDYNITTPVLVLDNVAAPEGYGLDDRYNAISDQFKHLSEACLGGSKISCLTIQKSAFKWSTESGIDKPRPTDGALWNDTLTVNMRLLSPMVAALGVANMILPIPSNKSDVINPWLVRITDNFEHGMRGDGSYKGGAAGTTSRKAAHNHASQSSNASMSVGALIGDQKLFNVGIDQWFITLGSMRLDGSLPIETRRGARALFYQGRAITSLTALAEKASVQQIDLWSLAPSDNKTIHLAVKFLIDAIEDPKLVLGYALTNKSPGPSKNYKRQDLGYSGSSTFGWVASYMARFPDHPNTTRLLRRIADPENVVKTYLTSTLDRQVKLNGTGQGDWNFVNGKCFYSK